MDTAEATEALSDVLLTGASPLADLRLCPRLHQQLQAATAHADHRMWLEAGLALDRAYRMLGAASPVGFAAEMGYRWSVGAHPIQATARSPPSGYWN